jgi:DNA-binding transcriptional LysR family regulator
VNLTQLECFLAVARELHFAKAAQRLHRSPASVSEAVSALERAVGGALFVRNSRRVELTQHGLAFLADVEDPYQQLERAHRVARERGEKRYLAHVGHNAELGHLLLPGLYAATPRHGEFALKLWKPELMPTQDQARAVESGVLDVGLCWSAPSRPALRCFEIREVSVVAVLPGEDPLAEQSTVRLEHLAGRPILMTPRHDNPDLDRRVRTAFAHASTEPADIREVARYDELALQVATSRFAGLHPETIALGNRVPNVCFRKVDPPITTSICTLVREDYDDPMFDPLLDTLATLAGELDLGG